MSRSRTLHVDAASPFAHATSLEEAVVRLMSDEYDAIVLHRHSAEWDEYGVVAWLAGTWPQFLRAITARSVSTDGQTAVWNAATGRFEREAPRPSRVHGTQQSAHRVSDRLELAV